jgi:hypothetical protein
MYSAIFEIVGNIFKVLWPMLLALDIALVSFRYGESHIQKQWDSEKAIQLSESAKVLQKAQDKIDSLTKDTITLDKHIGVVYNEHTETIKQLEATSNSLLSERLQRERTSCDASTMSSSTESTGISMDTSTTRTRTFLEESGKSLISESKLADTLVESLRSCRTWVTFLETKLGVQQ